MTGQTHKEFLYHSGLIEKLFENFYRFRPENVDFSLNKINLYYCDTRNFGDKTTLRRSGLGPGWNNFSGEKTRIKTFKTKITKKNKRN